MESIESEITCSTCPTCKIALEWSDFNNKQHMEACQKRNEKSNSKKLKRKPRVSVRPISSFFNCE